MKQNQYHLPITLDIGDNIELVIYSVQWFSNPIEEEAIGNLYVYDSYLHTFKNYTIWFDDEGEHYVCLPHYDEERLAYDPEDELDAYNVHDLLQGNMMFVI